MLFKNSNSNMVLTNILWRLQILGFDCKTGFLVTPSQIHLYRYFYSRLQEINRPNMNPNLATVGMCNNLSISPTLQTTPYCAYVLYLHTQTRIRNFAIVVHKKSNFNHNILQTMSNTSWTLATVQQKVQSKDCIVIQDFFRYMYNLS
jgi:hypothetical protein